MKASSKRIAGFELQACKSLQVTPPSRVDPEECLSVGRVWRFWMDDIDEENRLRTLHLQRIELAAGISHNVPHVCDVAPSPTRARGHVAERRAAAPRSPSRPEGAAMHIRAVMCRCSKFQDHSHFSSNDMIGLNKAFLHSQITYPIER